MNAYRDNRFSEIPLPSPPLYATTFGSTAHTSASTITYGLPPYSVADLCFIPISDKASSSTTLNYSITHFKATLPALRAHVFTMTLESNSTIGDRSPRWRWATLPLLLAHTVPHNITLHPSQTSNIHQWRYNTLSTPFYKYANVRHALTCTPLSHMRLIVWQAVRLPSPFNQTHQCESPRWP